MKNLVVGLVVMFSALTVNGQIQNIYKKDKFNQIETISQKGKGGLIGQHTLKSETTAQFKFKKVKDKAGVIYAVSIRLDRLPTAATFALTTGDRAVFLLENGETLSLLYDGKLTYSVKGEYQHFLNALVFLTKDQVEILANNKVQDFRMETFHEGNIEPKVNPYSEAKIHKFKKKGKSKLISDFAQNILLAEFK